MTDFFLALGLAILACISCMGYVFFLKKRNIANPYAIQIPSIEKNISALKAKTEEILSYCDNMTSLGQFHETQNLVNDLLMQLTNSRERFEELEAEVEKIKALVKNEEETHNSLKHGKEEAVALAEQTREAYQQLSLESKHLESQLNQSLSKLSVLSNEVALTKEQEEGLMKICTSLEEAKNHLNSLVEMHGQAMMRFNSLELQFEELEREFGKLVEKELETGV